MHLLSRVRTGFPPTSTFGEHTQGPAMAGTHGCGVNTPKAAAVAEATTGLESVVHIPKPVMLDMGAISVITQAGLPPTRTIWLLVDIMVAGATPKGHMQVAPVDTTGVIAVPFHNRFRVSL
jgi:hypothetical protein